MIDILPRPLLLLFSSLFFASVSSLLVNVTVDDQFGDPVTGLIPEYSPKNGSWHIGSPSEACPPACNIGPSLLDLTQINDKTWLDDTYWPSDGPATIKVHFTGSALYVFNILPNSVPGTTTYTNISFTIDGESAGRFTRTPDSSSTILYNQLVYHNTALDYGPHTLVMTPANVTLILFDYLVYTTQSNDTTNPDGSFRSSSTHTTPPVGGIVGAVLGGIALVAIAAGALFLFRRHTRSKAAAEISIYEGKYGENEGRSEHGYGVSPPGDHWPHTSLLSPAGVHPKHLPLSRNLPTAHGILPSDVSGPDTHPPLVSADASPGVPLPVTAEWSSKRREVLAQRLETLQRSRSVLSSQAPSRRSRSGFSSEGGPGTERAMRDLEAEIVQLRGVLAAMNVRLGYPGGHGVQIGEPLPAYEE
ncbi:hypothetical protein V8D89_007059 [Ganoderma adspersum]